jgi:Sugar (and other) transporter
MNAVQIIFAATGSMFVDSIGRRPMLIWVNVGCGLAWIGVTAASGVQASTGSKVSSGVTVAMIYLFQCIYSFGWTPLQALYPVEVLSFEMRAKGMAFSGMFVTAGKILKHFLISCMELTLSGTLVNQFGFPVSLDNIKWKTYAVFLIWCFIQAGIIYLLMPETKNRTVSPRIISQIDHELTASAA